MSADKLVIAGVRQDLSCDQLLKVKTYLFVLFHQWVARRFSEVIESDRRKLIDVEDLLKI